MSQSEGADKDFHSSTAHPLPHDKQTRDPVCGMEVEPATACHRVERGGTTTYFCSEHCREKFLANPAAYLKAIGPIAAGSQPLPASPGTIYTCPMHPQVRRNSPGNCPTCGMALEFLVATQNPARSTELRNMTHRFWISAALAAPVVALEMSEHLRGMALHRYLSPSASMWIQFALATPVVFGTGWPLLQRGAESARNRSLNMFTLITLGIGAAYLYSLAASFAPHLFPAGLKQKDGMIPVYYEAATVITVLVLLGQVLELQARERTGGAIRALLKLAPKTALRVHAEGDDEEIALEQVKIGDRLRVRPGDAVPVDGVVLEGKSAIDESMVTGESMPVEKEEGGNVIGGSINGAGTLVMQADKVGADTLLSRIVAMVADAQRSRAPVQRIADAVSAWFVPAVIAVALAAFVTWMIWGPAPAFAYALAAAVSVLIVACPCALGLATPMSIMVGIGRGAGAGILIRNAEALERFEMIDTLVVDKTGTLTEGKPSVVAVVAADGFDENTLLSLGASLERSSEHPLAAAIVASAKHRGMTLLPVWDFVSVAGKGVTGRVGARQVAVGNSKLLADLQVAGAGLDSRADDLRRDGATTMSIVVDGRMAGIIAVADPIKATTPTALAGLRAAGVRIVMLTGDNQITAQAVAVKLGITEVEAEVLPDQKYAIVRRLRSEGATVAMAGDGVNDAPALAEADVGVAMGTGTEVAMQSAGVTLVKGDLAGIARARNLSRATMGNIRQNLALAFIYNVLGIPIAAGALYPAFGVLLSPMVAAAAMSLSSVSVIANSLRLRFARL